MIQIYCLLDNYGVPFYVGQTKIGLEKRFNFHKTDSRRDYIHSKVTDIKELCRTELEIDADLLEDLWILKMRDHVINFRGGGLHGKSFKSQRYTEKCRLAGIARAKTLSQPIKQYDTSGKFIAKWSSALVAAKILFPHKVNSAHVNINKSCNKLGKKGQRLPYCGFIWNKIKP